MAKKTIKKITSVREHPRNVTVSLKNPEGVTIVDRHIRRLKGTYLDSDEIILVFKNYDRRGLPYPTSGKLSKFKNADKYDEIIAVWSDYFNKKFNATPPLDPDVVKALIASESSFNPDPPRNRKIALGLTQITKQTLKILQDPNGEAKELIFQDLRQKDLKDPNISIPLAVRWLHRKKETATSKLKRDPSHEEIILEYKGLLKSKSAYKWTGHESYLEAYAELKK
jgi:hypothetical protein